MGALLYSPMGDRSAKRGQWSGALRAIFMDNLRHALNARYPNSDNLPMSLQDDKGIPKSNTIRWLAGGAPRMDQLEELANALKLRAYELLMPGLNLGMPRNPRSRNRRSTARSLGADRTIQTPRPITN